MRELGAAMLYLDIPTPTEFRALAERRADACVSVYLPTTPITEDTVASRIDLRNRTREATRLLDQGRLEKRRLSAVADQLQDLADDDEFWRYQSSTLAVFATPDDVVTYRLPNNLQGRLDVSDRFNLAPITRTLSFPYSAFVLALSQGAVRLIELSETSVSGEVDVPDLPRNLEEATGAATPRDRAPSPRFHGPDGQTALVRQFARQIDRALRAYLAGQIQPLILAGVRYVLDVYRSVNSYPYLLHEQLEGNFDQMTAAELGKLARAVLTREYHLRIGDLRRRFEEFRSQGRTSVDVKEIARLASRGAVDTLLMDIERPVHGYVTDSGAVLVSDAPHSANYDIIGEVAIRAFLTGATLFGLRREDMPDNATAAALLRYR